MTHEQRSIAAQAEIVQVLHLFRCGYSVDSIRREVPSMTRGEIVDLLNLHTEIGARIAKREGGAQ